MIEIHFFLCLGEPDIDYKDVSRTGFEHARHLQNISLSAEVAVLRSRIRIFSMDNGFTNTVEVIINQETGR